MITHTHTHRNRRTCRQTGRHTNVHTHTHIHTETDGQKDRQTDKHANIHTHIQSKLIVVINFDRANVKCRRHLLMVHRNKAEQVLCHINVMSTKIKR